LEVNIRVGSGRPSEGESLNVGSTASLISRSMEAFTNWVTGNVEDEAVLAVFAIPSTPADSVL
jgi:hypothetical protein